MNIIPIVLNELISAFSAQIWRPWIQKTDHRSKRIPPIAPTSMCNESTAELYKHWEYLTEKKIIQKFNFTFKFTVCNWEYIERIV